MTLHSTAQYLDKVIQILLNITFSFVHKRKKVNWNKICESHYIFFSDSNCLQWQLFVTSTCLNRVFSLLRFIICEINIKCFCWWLTVYFFIIMMIAIQMFISDCQFKKYGDICNLQAVVVIVYWTHKHVYEYIHFISIYLSNVYSCHSPCRNKQTQRKF